MREKGQAAMEYLMTYGWAILIIIVVIGALFAMGVFKTESAVACSPCFSNFAFVDYSGGTLVVRNGPNEIDTVSASAVPDAGDAVNVSSTTVDPGYTLTLQNIDTSGDIEVTITYNHAVSGLTHTDVATIHN